MALTGLISTPGIKTETDINYPFINLFNAYPDNKYLFPDFYISGCGWVIFEKESFHLARILADMVAK